MVNLNLADPQAVESAIESIRPQWVFHLAAHGAYSYQTDIHSIVETNITGAVNLVEACLRAGVEAFVNTGSSSEYGLKDHPPGEDEPLEPNSHYAWTKAAATGYCRYTATSTGRRIPTLRLYSVYGPYEEPGRLVPTLVSMGLEGQLPPLADRRIARDFVYIDDVCDAYLAAATRPLADPGAIFNVGTGVQTTLAQAVEATRSRLAIHALPLWGSLPQRSWDTTTWVARPDKIRSQLGWQARHNFAEGLDLTVQWFESNPGLAERYRPGSAVVGSVPIG